MRIINKTCLSLMSLAVCMMTACSDGSDNLMPSAPENLGFEVDPEATDAESMIRRNFYEKTGIHLLFNDTISQYDDGSYELVDFNWSLNNYSSNEYRFDYLKDTDEMQKAADIIADYFVPYIKDGKLKPFSILPFYKAEMYDFSYDIYDYEWMLQDYIINWRCLAVSTINWDDLDADEYREAGLSLLKNFVSSKLDYRAPELADFIAVNKNEYYEYIEDYIPDFFEEEDITDIYNFGFLSYDSYWESFPGEDDDLDDFKRLIFDYSEAEVLELYGDYAKIMQKYQLLRQAITDMGINLDAEIKP